MRCRTIRALSKSISGAEAMLSIDTIDLAYGSSQILRRVSLQAAKGVELAATPYASATFPWYQLGRQVHIRGPVTKVAPQVTEDYWSKRPRGSQLGAWASHQSQPIASRAALLDQLAEVTERFADSERVPVPPEWGGYLIAADVVEFWQGRENRVHNRIRVSGAHIERLQP